PETIMGDQPVDIDAWQPKNYDEQYRGRATLRTAFAQSLTSVAAHAAQTVGLHKHNATANRLRMQPEWPSVPNLAPGPAELAPAVDRRAAGKAGTTDEYRDAWFAGFTSDIVVGVWVGNDDNSQMEKVAGGEIPAKIWHDFVSEAEKIIAKPGAPAPEVLTGSGSPPPAGAEQKKQAQPPAGLQPA